MLTYSLYYSRVKVPSSVISNRFYSFYVYYHGPLLRRKSRKFKGPVKYLFIKAKMIKIETLLNLEGGLKKHSNFELKKNSNVLKENK